jgi:hypothetical protein
MKSERVRIKIKRGKIIQGSKVVCRNWQEATMEIPVVEKVVEQLKNLPQELQWRVLEFTRALAGSAPHGVAGLQLLRFAGAIPLDDVNVMRETIEQGCEQADENEW